MKEAVKNNMPGMQSVYLNEVKAKLTEEFGYKNQMEIPKMQKIAVNVGMGESLTNKNAIESMVGDLTMITGQKPVVTKAKISIANFHFLENKCFEEKVRKTLKNIILDFANIHPPLGLHFPPIQLFLHQGQGQQFAYLDKMR